MADITDTRFHWGWSVDPPEPVGCLSLQMDFGRAFLSMSIRGFDAMPDDMLIGFWLADNFDGTPEEAPPVEMSQTRRALQEMIDGPMIGSGIGSR